MLLREAGAEPVTEGRAGHGPSLLPREHGAYAQLGFPLVTALALGDLGVAPLLLVVGIIAVFLVHEPVMVLSGGRGAVVGDTDRALLSRRPSSIGRAARSPDPQASGKDTYR